jgi:hypothetical protein
MAVTSVLVARTPPAGVEAFLRHEAAVRRCSASTATYGVNFTVITSPSRIA